MKARIAAVFLAAALLEANADAATVHCKTAHGAAATCHKKSLKTPPLRMQAAKDESPPDTTDTRYAITVRQAGRLPSTREQFDTLKSRIVRERPAMLDARGKSEALKAQALALEQKLIDTARRVVELEGEQQRLDREISRLQAEDERMSAEFVRDRKSVARLLAVLERMQHDMPPAIVLHPDDALSAARGAMLIGASVPNVYAEAKALALRIRALKETRISLLARRAEGRRNAEALEISRGQLDRLLASKKVEADAASARYGDLASDLARAAEQATDLKALLEKISSLRAAPVPQNVQLVAPKADEPAPQKPRALIAPVAGSFSPGGVDGVGGSRAPGITFSTGPGARVIAPADSRVIFAGPYHKTGQVLILEVGAAYDVVLSGLGRVDVHPGDAVLTGEPVGTMPNSAQHELLYFELRLEGHGKSPAPWLAVELRKAQK
ncbi:MAG: peptidoglycan DD-metalloendopeptidase family protein [Alphaproteobacteria bacterium]|nr:peptidoglycan DD-metalloendopeptidase family protein [Alphaproteobacteria bacterium]MBV9695272.1 peptidoglycan DD-metalloendopeptidase family protein [Alphaproteobacteria bacterium]